MSFGCSLKGHCYTKFLESFAGVPPHDENYIQREMSQDQRPYKVAQSVLGHYILVVVAEDEATVLNKV